MVAIIDADGNVKVEYTYDAWGKILSISGPMADTLGAVNPLTYRGYVYDTETDRYYLESRYYDPAVERFINADVIISTGDMLGCNLFSYCGNNPVNREDPTGHSWKAIIELVCQVLLDVLGPAASPVDPSIPTPPSGTQPTEPVPGYKDFLDDLAMRESSNNYGVTNSQGFLGRYQMGYPALQDAGFWEPTNKWTSLANSYGVYSKEDFLNSPSAQDAAVIAYHKRLCGYIKHYQMDQYIGTVYNNTVVTLSGLLASSHLVGAKAMSVALKSGAVVYDGNGVPAHEYMELFAGYYISEVSGE